MDFIFELLLELITEETVELSKNRKVPKCIRCLLIVIIVLFFAGIIGITLFAAFVTIKENLILGIILIAASLLMLVMGIVKFRKTYLMRKNIK